MRLILVMAVAVMLFGVMVGQQGKPVNEVPPGLSTSERVALQALEEKKQEAQKQYQQASQVEGGIAVEWATAHPGWHLNAVTFAVEKDVVTEVPKTAAKAGSGTSAGTPAAEPKKK